MRVFDYSEPSEEILASTISISPDLWRSDYQPLYPSFTYPPALLAAFHSPAQIEVLFEHLAETYLSTHYQETRDWYAYVRKNASVGAIEAWVKELSDQRNVNLLEPLAGSTGWQSLFSTEPGEGVNGSIEQLAQQLVEAILSASCEAFPEVLEHVGLPGTYDQLRELTPYPLAVQVYRRWEAQEQIFDVLDMHTELLMSEQLQACMRFCLRAILHRFNLQIRPEYRVLFERLEED